MKRMYRYVLYLHSGTQDAEIVMGETLWDDQLYAIKDIPKKFRLVDPDKNWVLQGNTKPKYGGQTYRQRKGNSIYYIQPVYV